MRKDEYSEIANDWMTTHLNDVNVMLLLRRRLQSVGFHQDCLCWFLPKDWEPNRPPSHDHGQADRILDIPVVWCDTHCIHIGISQ